MLEKIKLNIFYKFLILTFLIINAPLLAQEQKLTFGIKSNPTDLDYWWLEKNNFGIKPANFSFRSSWELKTAKTTYIINIIAQDDSEKIYLNESSIKHSFSDKTFLRVGRYYKDFSNYLNDDLSSGHMLISHNARPMPKIGFVTSKKIKKLDRLTFDFGIAHGFFDKDDYYIEAPFLHEKFLYMHINKNKDYQFSLGLVHEAMWAGANPDRDFPSSLKDFLKVIIAEDGFDEGIVTHQNALGSHIAIWDFLFQKRDDEKLLQLYYQHIFEDTSGLRFKNRFDGLWGFEIKNYVPNTNFLVEYLVTSSQFRNPPYVAESYYRNYQYKLGWSYQGYTLGNPYIEPPEVENHLAVNPVDVIHFGMNGKILSSYYKIKFSRKTSISDSFQYKISINKKITNTIFNRNLDGNFNIGLFIVNSDDKKGGGLIFSKQL